MKDEELLRYSRQIMLPAFDVEGQERIIQSKVLVIGLGGLGCPVAMYLTAAGVGELTLVDFDEVDLSNLQRQIAHGQLNIGQPKVESAAQTLLGLNESVKLNVINKKLSDEEMAAQVELHDAIVDCSDNFTTRYLLNKLAVKYSKPLISGAAVRMEGQISVFDMRDSESPCYHCLYGDMGDENLSCAENGILAPVVGVIGSLQALETLKCVARVGKSLKGRLMVFDALSLEWRTMKLSKDPKCKVCSQS